MRRNSTEFTSRRDSTFFGEKIMAKFNGTARRRFGMEVLETKAMMAGDVAVSFSGGELNIQGDVFDNSLEVVQAANGNLTVRGLLDANGIATTINGRAAVSFPAAVVSKSQISLADGNDSVSIRNVSIGSDLKIDSGAGNDRVTTSGLRVGVVVGSSAEILTGVGNDIVTISNTSVTGDLVADTGEGADTVTVNNGSLIGKTAKAITGAGNDVVRFVNSTVNGTLEAQTDVGNDTVTITGVTVRESMLVDTGEGADRITIRDSSATADISAVAGSGNDTVIVERVDSGASVNVIADSGADKVTARNITAAIDIVLDGGADLDSLIRDALFPGNALIISDFESIM